MREIAEECELTALVVDMVNQHKLDQYGEAGEEEGFKEKVHG